MQFLSLSVAAPRYDAGDAIKFGGKVPISGDIQHGPT